MPVDTSDLPALQRRVEEILRRSRGDDSHAAVLIIDMFCDDSPNNIARQWDPFLDGELLGEARPGGSNSIHAPQDSPTESASPTESTQDRFDLI
jgi:hypothetical protein